MIWHNNVKSIELIKQNKYSFHLHRADAVGYITERAASLATGTVKYFLGLVWTEVFGTKRPTRLSSALELMAIYAFSPKTTYIFPSKSRSPKWQSFILSNGFAQL